MQPIHQHVHQHDVELVSARRCLCLGFHVKPVGIQPPRPTYNLLGLDAIGHLDHQFDRTMDGNIPHASRRWTDAAALFLPGAGFERRNLKPEIRWNPSGCLRE
jgi:hypothetical protein